MEYRDLIPGRCGGRFVGSHIKITEGGPVPDYVHSHNLRFQFVYCYKGWVRLVYEGQVRHGCKLQPKPRRFCAALDHLQVLYMAVAFRFQSLIHYWIPYIDIGSHQNSVYYCFGIKFRVLLLWMVCVLIALQGAPFVMRAGDCVLQPPGIKHRVLESSAGLEVIEVACPAEHETTREVSHWHFRSTIFD
jgi:quercetin dioxygenase-like cupin family protein